MQKKTRFQKQFEQKIAPALQKELGEKNRLAVPKFTRAVINVGLKHGLKDPKFVDAVESTLKKISGQRPVKTKARKSIASFKIREGNVVGMAVTMRGARMYDFLDKLINLTLPRVRDFHGLTEKSVDKHGNISIGFREFIAFPEISAEDADIPHGLEVTIVTNAHDYKKGLALLKAAGFPFRAAQTNK
ncbi:50S ribosomal protein L5 [Patescibacteria group bacterium]|nr:50S ribosomal protein L5 [Patescibacteria group bacterium]MBU1915815.1 50S ribosomal protein L5 [Patescibacteria group bacterium]